MGNPALVRELRARLALPAVAGPMFLVSSVKLTLACCRAGIIGSLPALNARSSDIFEIWMAQMAPQAGELGMAPYAINII
ncbi:MAG TPA: nitronate monooxygenase, partial [Hyphomonas sp.]|nr:nitronate monooxygenase [Hyphomonas sp.]